MTAVATSTCQVALIGNPNTGKSTLFSALAGIHQHVGNYPGVTVEKKTGEMQFAGRRFELIDLPGLYSLAPRSRDEMVTLDALLGRFQDVEPVDVVLCVVDASNLERNLYLVSQVLDLGLPTVVALNMLDVAKRRGCDIDLIELQTRLGVPVVGVQAHRRQGIAELKVALARAGESCPPPPVVTLPAAFEREAADLLPLVSPYLQQSVRGAASHAGLARRLLLDACGRLGKALLGDAQPEVAALLNAARERLAAEGLAAPKLETTARYAWAEGVVQSSVRQVGQSGPTFSDRLDAVLTHWFWGTAIFALLMLVVFQSVFTWAEPPMKWIDSVFGSLGEAVVSRMQEGALRSLLVDGVIGGVGGVLVFLPQILVLFLFIAILEDCGYLARAAFLMDRHMSRVGLSGKSFIPMLSCFACTVPGIMAARVIEDERDRLTTILVAPLLTCSARLPVYTMLIAAFIPDQAYFGGLLRLQGLTLAGLYLLGIVAAIVVATILKRTLLRGEPTPFLLELPTYKWPSLRTALHRVLERGWVFLRVAGTLIFAVSVLVWAALYYPHNAPSAEKLVAERVALEHQLATAPNDDAPATAKEQLAELDQQIEAEYQRHSILGYAGRFVEPVVRPLGWDWRIGCAAIASFPAREIVIATMGVMYNVGEVDDSEESQLRLRKRLQEATWDGTDRPVFTLPVALSIMVFFALCAQCAATLAVIRRETNSWRWPLFAFTYMTVLAYLAALVMYQAGTWLGVQVR
ncbi:MAG: ferrous iron transport protein B [Planctomycetota bacterium]